MYKIYTNGSQIVIQGTGNILLHLNIRFNIIKIYKHTSDNLA